MKATKPVKTTAIACPNCDALNEIVLDREKLGGEGQDEICETCGQAYLVSQSKEGLPIAIAL